MSSKPVIITIGLNDAPLRRGLSGVTQQMRKLQASAQDMGHGTVSSMQASSAAIRVLEGGLQGNIRAAERFIRNASGHRDRAPGRIPGDRRNRARWRFRKDRDRGCQLRQEDE